MRNFQCVCGQVLFFENTICTACQRRLGYDPLRAELLALDPVFDEYGQPTHWWRSADFGIQYHLCLNDIEFHVCNWLVTNPENSYCSACELNHIIPKVESSYRALQRRQWWASMEQAKRRLLYTLMAMGLPVVGKAESHVEGLAFAFLEDQRSNPRVHEKHVLTGHLSGLITVNLAEADHVEREIARQGLGESYRTLLGHFRHESGHYYYDQLIVTDGLREEFRCLFGDERKDYESALADYYAHKDHMVRQPDMVSAYAQVHPLEDWAECWAHYLHMMDTLETASDYGLVASGIIDLRKRPDIEWCLREWSRVSVALNALNRSMGLEDAYPFVLSSQTLTKLRFVHRLIYPSSLPMQMEASGGTHP